MIGSWTPQNFETGWVKTRQVALRKFFGFAATLDLGKTVMAARLTEYLENIMLVSSFFCFFADERKKQPLSILRSWIAQLVLSHDDASDIVEEVYTHKKLRKATETDLWSIFKRLCIGLKDTLFIVNGFDECTREEMESRSHAVLDVRQRFLKNLEGSIAGSSTLIMILSRETPICAVNTSAMIKAHLGQFVGSNM